MDYAMQELIRVRDGLKVGEKVSMDEEDYDFYFFQFGGSGQRYSAEHVKLMREIQEIGGRMESLREE